MAFSLRNVAYRHVPPDPTRPDAPVQGIEIDRLDLPSTGLTAVIGPSGSGKSTLLSVLAGFLGAAIGDGGHLRFRGDDLAAGGHPPGRVAFVFQSSLLLSAGSGLVNILQGQVAAGRRPGHDPPTIGDVRHALDSLGLMDQRKILIAKRARHLSGGEAQRIAILRALLTDPDAILCDEPTSSLDEGNAHRALGTLKQWAEERQRPVVWVTHELDYAAEYANRFVFISGGRIAEPSPECRARLDAAMGGERLAVLRDIARDLKGDAPVDHLDEDDAAKDRPIRVGRARYAGWIANALSTDGQFTKGLSDTALAPAGVQRLLGGIAHGYRAPFGPLIRLARRPFSYSRYGVALVFFVLLLQMFGAMFIGQSAEFYSAERLQDPSVARIVFEHVVAGPALNGQGEPTELYADSSIPALESAIRDRLAQTIGTIDPARVMVRGRRTIDQSQLRFPAANQDCDDWQSLETVALAADDPLILQTGLAPGDDALLDSIEEAVAIARQSYRVGGERRIAFLQSHLVEILHGRCGLDPGEPLIAEWAAGTAGRREPLRLEIAGAIAEDPPLYPSAVDLIVFEHDYQAAANRQDGGAPPPFRIVTAYFPIDGFEATGAVIAEGGYRVRDDSAAAVDTLRRVAQIAAVVPPLFIALNLLAAVIVINRAIDSLFELHKRVLALFAAHGFRLRDIFTVLGLHLLPAFVASFVFLAALVYGGWSYVSDWLPPDFGPMEALRDTAFVYSSGIAVLVALSAMAIVVTVWWRHIGTHLKDLLQD